MPDRFSCKSNRPEQFSLILSDSYSILVGKIVLGFMSSFPIVFNHSAVFVIVMVFIIFAFETSTFTSTQQKELLEICNFLQLEFLFS